ncbi:hypothetical protein ABVK25_003896 [Lepraria finkii]|uniref:Secreted protein n=1 Tax=Lepraria finkii TaxID=1340010 RepID=A0ABR4BFT9_9LECA
MLLFKRLEYLAGRVMGLLASGFLFHRRLASFGALEGRGTKGPTPLARTAQLTEFGEETFVNQVIPWNSDSTKTRPSRKYSRPPPLIIDVRVHLRSSP